MIFSYHHYFNGKQEYLKVFIQILTIGFIFIFSIMFSGCELLKADNTKAPLEKTNINYGQYYLLLSEFNEQQIADEVQQHLSLKIPKIASDNQNIEWQLKSVLLYALPSSSIYNPFTAKSKLNQISLGKPDKKSLSVADFAYFNMLKTQLNQQIILLNKLAAEKKHRQKSEQIYQQQQQQLKELQQQIIQLKKIEKNINEHGQ